MKKIILTIGTIGFWGIICMLFWGVNAQAYLDPAIVTYVIQAVVGAAVAIGAAVGIYWRKAKKKIDDKLGIDENRNKEVESDDFEVNE